MWTGVFAVRRTLTVAQPSVEAVTSLGRAEGAITSMGTETKRTWIVVCAADLSADSASD